MKIDSSSVEIMNGYINSTVGPAIKNRFGGALTFDADGFRDSTGRPLTAREVLFPSVNRFLAALVEKACGQSVDEISADVTDILKDYQKGTAAGARLYIVPRGTSRTTDVVICHFDGEKRKVEASLSDAIKTLNS